MPRDALLLLGPTGAGKSPLGDLLELDGLWGRPCRHFDFGARLRAVASGSLRPAGIEDRQVTEIRTAVETGSLLTDAQRPIAQAILDDFLGAGPAGTEDSLVVLNGLPRHRGQVEAVTDRLQVRWVVRLSAGTEVLRERIQRNTGGDRTGRTDDDPAAVAARLERFRARTLLLVDEFRARGARILPVEVGPRTSARDAMEALARR